MSISRPILFAAVLALAACGKDQPSAEDFRRAVDAQLQQQATQFGAVLGVKVSDKDLPRVVSVDNIRKRDEATFVADVTMELKGRGLKETSSVAMRRIEKQWRLVE